MPSRFSLKVAFSLCFRKVIQILTDTTHQRRDWKRFFRLGLALLASRLPPRNVQELESRLSQADFTTRRITVGRHDRILARQSTGKILFLDNRWLATWNSELRNCLDC